MKGMTYRYTSSTRAQRYNISARYRSPSFRILSLPNGVSNQQISDRKRWQLAVALTMSSPSHRGVWIRERKESEERRNMRDVKNCENRGCQEGITSFSAGSMKSEVMGRRTLTMKHDRWNCPWISHSAECNIHDGRSVSRGF